MTTTTYEGWSNRETWCANLWLANDYGLYTEITGLTEDALRDAQEATEGDAEEVARQATMVMADWLKDFFDGFAADIVEGKSTSETVRLMVLDIGSLYRVDWYEVAASWVGDAIAEMSA